MIGDKLDAPEQAVRRGDRLEVLLWYPRTPGNVKEIHVDLVDVRAADGILISYDFDRDGYSIKQASTFQWEMDDKVCDKDWQEVAFVKAWGREKKDRP